MKTFQTEAEQRRAQKLRARWAVVWRRKFKPGAILEGCHNVWDRLEFVDRWHCAQWLKGVRRNIRAGKLEWTFADRPTTAKVIGSAPYGWSRIEGGQE